MQSVRSWLWLPSLLRGDQEAFYNALVPPKLSVIFGGLWLCVFDLILQTIISHASLNLLFQNQHDDLKKQFFELQEKHQVQSEDHGKVLEDHRQKYDDLQQTKELEIARLKGDSQGSSRPLEVLLWNAVE